MNTIGRSRPYPHVSITILPLGEDTHVLFSYPGNHRRYCNHFFEQYEAGGDEERQVWLTKLLLNSYENVAFSPDYVDGLGAHNRQLIEGWIRHLYENELPMPYIPNFNFFE